MTDAVQLAGAGSDVALKAEFLAAYQKALYEIQEGCKEQEQVELPLLHDFTPGLYLRRIFMPSGTFVIGKTHKTEHFNMILAGSANVMIDGEIRLIKAGDVFISKAGTKKVLHIIEDMIWATTHATEETDPEKLESLCIYTDEEEKQLMLGGSYDLGSGSDSGGNPDRFLHEPATTSGSAEGGK